MVEESFRYALADFIKERSLPRLPDDGSPTLGTAILEFLVRKNYTPFPSPHYVRHESAHVISGFGSPETEGPISLIDEDRTALFAAVINHGLPNITDSKTGEMRLPPGPNIPEKSKVKVIIARSHRDANHESVVKLSEEFFAKYRPEIGQLIKRLGGVKELDQLMHFDDPYNTPDEGIRDDRRKVTIIFREIIGPERAEEEAVLREDYNDFFEGIYQKAASRTQANYAFLSEREFDQIYESAFFVEHYLNQWSQEAHGMDWWQLAHDQLISTPLRVVKEARDIFEQALNRDGPASHVERISNKNKGKGPAIPV